jgi:hypothetical protein
VNSAPVSNVWGPKGVLGWHLKGGGCIAQMQRNFPYPPFPSLPLLHPPIRKTVKMVPIDVGVIEPWGLSCFSRAVLMKGPEGSGLHQSFNCPELAPSSGQFKPPLKPRFFRTYEGSMEPKMSSIGRCWI